ncbi:MAG: restriction endonuclease [Bacteroidia bacterium]|nr:restriction endonuclease [Bacteroidia bacterium]
MLDMLPQELFRDPNARFLDPACKSGIFLREIAKRLLNGLEESIPDRQERIDHIFHKQLYGIAITELTSLLARRSLYCSKHASSIYSVTPFGDAEGNIRFRRIEHKWNVNGKCQYCGVLKDQFDRGKELETHAYEFTHINNIKELLDMKFDLIISNPPYQLTVGIEKENYAIPIYHNFVEQAKKLKPRYLTMIIPARWYAGGRGLEDFREIMLNDNRIRILHDFPNAVDCFPGVDIAGGVCYFLWNRDDKGECKVSTHKGSEVLSTVERPLLEKNCVTFIRQNEAISILHKVGSHKEDSFARYVSPQTPFGLISSFRDFSQEPFEGSIKYYTYGFRGYLRKDQIPKNYDWVPKHKIYLSKAYGERGKYPYFFLGKPFYGEPNSCCSQSYLLIGPYNSKAECNNVMSYMRTKFFRALIMLIKNTQDNMSHVFRLVPIQNFDKQWTDEELYAKYGFDFEEISFIESMIRPMDVGGSDE